MSLEEFDLLEIPVVCCLQVAHVRHRRSNQGADTFGVPINSVIITALAAIAGSLVGALGSAVGTWITARHQDRRDLLGKQIARREALYSDFIGESARLLVDAMQHNVSEVGIQRRSEEHTSELQSRLHLVCRLLLEKKKATDSSAAPGAPR